MKDVSKRDELIRNFAVQTQERKGGSASQMVDLFKLLIEGMDRDKKGGATNKTKVDAAERDKENFTKKAEADNASAQIGAKGKMSMLQRVQSTDDGVLQMNPVALMGYGFKGTGNDAKDQEKKQRLQKYINIQKKSIGKSAEALEKEYSQAGLNSFEERIEFEQIRKKLQKTTVDQTDQPNLTKPPEERPGGLTPENAKEIGKAFAKEFFDEAESRAAKNAEKLKDSNSNKGNFVGGLYFGFGGIR
jgi:hypothetical protein